MIILAPGHSTDHPGARLDDHNEHAEARGWVEALAALLSQPVSVALGTARQKAAVITELRPRIAVEWHFGSNHTDSTSGVVALSPKRGCLRSVEFACRLEQALPAARLTPGWYRGDETQGEDFFLLHSPSPAILITVDQFTNLTYARAQRERILQVTADQLRQLPSHGDSQIS